jgi:hypothetical protein
MLIYLNTILIIFLIGYIWVNFEPIQDKLLEYDYIWLKPLKCLKCFYFWSSLIYTSIVIISEMDVNKITIWLVSVAIIIKLNK